MEYFKSLPKMYYSFDLNQSPKLVTNIFSRFKFKQSVLNNAYINYKYQIKDGDTPEIVAYQQYGDPTLHWIICMTNGLIDAKFDFPLNASDLDKKIIKQYNYTSIEDSFSAVHHYILQTTKTLTEVNGPTTTTTSNCIVTLSQFSYSSNTLINKTINSPVTTTVQFTSNNSDPNTAVTSTLTITETYKAVYVFDYENELNESKRQIKLIKKQYIDAISGQVETILNT